MNLPRRALLPVASFAVFALLVAACSGSDDTPPATPTATAVPPTPEATPRPPAPPPTPTATAQRVPSTTLLIDARDGSSVTLHEDADVGASAHFDDEQPNTVLLHRHVRGPIEFRRFAFDGSDLGPAEWEGPFECYPGGSVEIDGRTHPECGYASPDGRWLAYAVDSPDVVPGWDQWVLDRHTGERRELAVGLQHCTPCGGLLGPAWSPSGRFFFYREYGGENRRFLSDLHTGETHVIDYEVRWSPAADLLIRPSGSGFTVIEDPATGETRELRALPWPAQFEPTGAYVYSWPPDRYAGSSPGFFLQTVVARVDTGQVVAALSGAPGYEREHDALFPGTADPAWGAPHPLVGTGDSFVAALPGSQDCEGIAIYRGAVLVTCVDDGAGAVPSPGGAYVALVVKTGETGMAEGPGIQTMGFNIYDIVIVDVATGDQRVVASGAVGGSSHGPGQSVHPVSLSWNQAGTHLLIGWPFNGYGY